MNDDLEFIKKFSKINITNCCIDAKVNRANVLNGTASRQATKKLKRQIEDAIARLYIIKDDKDEERKDSL